MSDYDVIQELIYQHAGDAGRDFYSVPAVDAGLSAALGRYARVVECAQARILTLAEDGLFGHSLAAWDDLPGAGRLQEVAYLHWPAAAQVSAVLGDNLLMDWWYYRDAAGALRVDLQADGPTLPAAGDALLVVGVLQPAVQGFAYQGETGAATSLPAAHFNLLALGAAAYCLRAREAALALSPAGIGGYASAYHVNVLSGLASAYLADFDAELAAIRAKRLERPPWGMPERKRMRRLQEARP